ncbi:hypothetical protein QJS10_CPB20g01849 [Acorus calamus]|uniref:Uncharacterized protein n=1 Tax=Acorus calamus TaxID=4465 RepID=A0AAV9CEI8_ACOCL|nr:hypothetical protein QJS10_CPB20g01849 [Acorus calamus]
MAAAEARAAWQRTANRCFVQEDAKRAPKLAYCPSSSSSSKQQSDSGSDEASNGMEHPLANVIPLNWIPTNSNLPPNTKWWLQLQPNFGHLQDFTCEQISASLEDELDSLKPVGAPHVDIDKNSCDSLKPPLHGCANFKKREIEVKSHDMKVINSDLPQPFKHKKDANDYLAEDELMSKKQGMDCDFETPWAGCEKAEPWWRIADKDELASLVTQKSLQHFENCDLPRPQTIRHIRKDPLTCVERFDGDGFLSSLDHKLHGGICNLFDSTDHSSASGSLDGKQRPPIEAGRSIYGSDNSSSNSNTRISCTKSPIENKHHQKTDSNKAELLEALRHSQTRAREAEMAAQQAYNEKEHLVKLLFRQASHLFAYKQWVHLLQLEKLSLLQLRLREHQSFRHPKKKRSDGWPKCGFCKFAVALAVGCAGLILGWTMGWLLPTF